MTGNTNISTWQAKRYASAEILDNQTINKQVTNMELKIAVMDYDFGDVNIITVDTDFIRMFAESVGDSYDEDDNTEAIRTFLSGHCGYSLNNIEWMVVKNFKPSLTPYSFASDFDYAAHELPLTQPVAVWDEFPISAVTRVDLQDVGYDAEHLDDDDMRLLAGKMSEAYGANGFLGDLRDIADELDIPRLSEEAWHEITKQRYQ
jgi:hypothetical protein